MKDKNRLPSQIQDIFIDFYNGKIGLQDFETWLYNNKELEHLLKDEYLSTIVLNFRESDAIIQVKKIMDAYLNYDEYEKRQILKILNSIISMDDDLPGSLKMIYKLATSGEYDFLHELELHTYSLTYEVGIAYRDDWKSLNANQRKDLIHPFYDKIAMIVRNLIKSLDEQKILFNAKLSKVGQFTL